MDLQVRGRAGQGVHPRVSRQGGLIAYQGLLICSSMIIYVISHQSICLFFVPFPRCTSLYLSEKKKYVEKYEVKIKISWRFIYVYYLYIYLIRNYYVHLM